MADDVRQGSIVEEIIDEIVPEELDWERLVRTYPLPAVALVALGGFFLGFRHGPEILQAVSGFAAAEVSKNVSQIIGQEIG
jgi:hypothetical protein